MTSLAKTAGELLGRSPDGFDTVQWLDTTGRVRTARAARELLGEDFSVVAPLREGVQYQNRHNRHSRYYFLPQRKHVFCESALESDAAMRLEFEGRATRLSSQPMLMLFKAGARVVKHYSTLR